MKKLSLYTLILLAVSTYNASAAIPVFKSYVDQRVNAALDAQSTTTTYSACAAQLATTKAAYDNVRSTQNPANQRWSIVFPGGLSQATSLQGYKNASDLHFDYNYFKQELNDRGAQRCAALQTVPPVAAPIVSATNPAYKAYTDKRVAAVLDALPATTTQAACIAQLTQAKQAHEGVFPTRNQSSQKWSINFQGNNSSSTSLQGYASKDKLLRDYAYFTDQLDYRGQQLCLRLPITTNEVIPIAKWYVDQRVDLALSRIAVGTERNCLYNLASAENLYYKNKRPYKDYKTQKWNVDFFVATDVSLKGYGSESSIKQDYAYFLQEFRAKGEELCKGPVQTVAATSPAYEPFSPPLPPVTTTYTTTGPTYTTSTGGGFTGGGGQAAPTTNTYTITTKRPTTQLATPPTTQLPTPSTIQLPTPSTTQLPTPSTTQLPTPSTTQLPTPSTIQLPTPSTTQLPTPSTAQSLPSSSGLGCVIVGDICIFPPPQDPPPQAPPPIVSLPQPRPPTPDACAAFPDRFISRIVICVPFGADPTRGRKANRETWFTAVRTPGAFTADCSYKSEFRIKPIGRYLPCDLP